MRSCTSVWERPSPLLPFPGIDLVWDAHMALARLAETHARLWVISSRSRQRQDFFSRGGYQHMPAGFWAYARRLELWTDPHLMETFTRCRSCRVATPWMVYMADERWCCAYCHPRWKGRLQMDSDALLANRIARYQFGLLLGTNTRAMRLRRERLRNRVDGRLRSRIRTTERTLWLVSIAAELLRIKPYWIQAGSIQAKLRRQHLPLASPMRSTWWYSLAPIIMETMVEQLLQPETCVQRYVVWLRHRQVPGTSGLYTTNGDVEGVSNGVERAGHSGDGVVSGDDGVCGSSS